MKYYVRSNISGEYLAETDDPDEAQRIRDKQGTIKMVVDKKAKSLKRAYIEPEQRRNHIIFRVTIYPIETGLESIVTEMIPLVPWNRERVD